MKIFKINPIIVMVVVGVLQTACLLHARISLPQQNKGTIETILVAYNNKIEQVSHAVGSHAQHSITFVCEKKPICMYTPLNIESIEGTSLTKSYFLPRIKCTGAQMRSMHSSLQDSLQPLGIDVQFVNHSTNANYGIQMNFTMPSPDSYDIVKVIDADAKTVRFDIAAKI